MSKVGQHDVAIVGAPFDGGSTFRPGARFGPEGIRRTSGMYSPYNYEMAMDLREQITFCDVGDIFTIPANLEKTFDQISNALAYIATSGAFPVVLGGDRSIGYATVRGLASVTSKKIGVI